MYFFTGGVEPRLRYPTWATQCQKKGAEKRKLEKE